LTRSRDNATNVAGDISGVTAGTGLSGGGTNGSVTLDLSTPVASTNGGTGLSSFTTGDMIYSSSGNTLAKLGIGTTSQVLTVASGIPSWATPSSGGMTSIASGNLSGSSVVLGSIPATYNQLLLELKNWHPTANGYGVDVIITGQTSGYRGSYLRNNNGTTSTGSATTDNLTRDILYAVKNDPNEYNYGSILFMNYASTNARKVFEIRGEVYTNANTPYGGLAVNAINYSSAISSITIGLEGGSATTFAAGTYTLWGIK